MSYLSETLAHDKLVLVDFFARGSKESKLVDSILDDLKQRIGKNILIIKVDVLSNKLLAKKYKVQNTPTLALYRHSKQLWRKSGSKITKAKLLATITKILKY